MSGIKWNGSSASTKQYKVVIEGHSWMLSEDDTQKIVDILNGMTNNTSVKAPSKPKKEYKATDVTVEMTAKGKTVQLQSYCKKDVWQILQTRFEAVGAKYDKTVKLINFKTAADAKKFAANNKITADERQAVWTAWANK